MPGDQTTSCLLIADVGGTNTRVALATGGQLRADTVSRFRNCEHGSLDEVLKLYVDNHGPLSLSSAAVAVAGPVQDGRGELTNLDWSIDERTLAQSTGASRVAVLNDLQAQGFALDQLDGSQLRTVVSGPRPGNSPCLVVGVGTGFNASPVHRTESHRHVPPSETGHTSLPVTGAEDVDLWHWINADSGYPEVEDVLSGRGLENVYRWRCQASGLSDRKTAAEIMASCENGGDPTAREAVSVFVRILGTVCGNLSLIHLPFGGVFLVGGVARAIAPHLEKHGFAEAYRNKGRFAEFMENFSVHVVEDDYAALPGLAAYLET